MSKHTPGPWRAFLNKGVIGVAPANGQYRAGDIAICSDHDSRRTNEEAMANARLISAAPDMLEALEALHDEIDEYQRINNLGGHDNHVMKQARAAIAKAKGAA